MKANTGDFDEFFRRAEQGRAAFLARLFGLFSEQVVQHWCQYPEAAYGNLGRPTLREVGKQNPFCTLDFALQHRITKRVFVAEMKCWLQWDNFKLLRLVDKKQLESPDLKNTAFQWFLRLASNPTIFDVRVQTRPVKINGAILVWGATTPQGRDSVMAAHNIADVLSVEEMARDLRQWRPEGWVQFSNQHRRWCNELFDFLT